MEYEIKLNDKEVDIIITALSNFLYYEHVKELHQRFYKLRN